MEKGQTIIPTVGDPPVAGVGTSAGNCQAPIREVRLAHGPCQVPRQTLVVVRVYYPDDI